MNDIICYYLLNQTEYFQIPHRTKNEINQTKSLDREETSELSFQILASNNCDDDYVPDGENIEENTTLQIVITVIDQNDVTPKFNEETLFFSLTIGGEDYETFDAKANDSDENPQITYTKTEIEVSDDATGLEENVPSNGWFNITSDSNKAEIKANFIVGENMKGFFKFNLTANDGKHSSSEDCDN